jgi:hypothetical protein
VMLKFRSSTDVGLLVSLTVSTVFATKVAYLLNCVTRDVAQPFPTNQAHILAQEAQLRRVLLLGAERYTGIVSPLH